MDTTDTHYPLWYYWYAVSKIVNVVDKHNYVPVDHVPYLYQAQKQKVLKVQTELCIAYVFDNGTKSKTVRECTLTVL